MPQEIFVPRPDLVDDEFFIETRQTAAASATQWRTLEIARAEPRPYLPTVVLAGAHGSGLTTIANRFVRAAGRSVACDIVHEMLVARSPEANRAETKRHAAAWAEDMVRRHGQCPAICQPATWVPQGHIEHALAMSDNLAPVLGTEMSARPDRDLSWLSAPTWRSPGNVNHDPVRRTSMVLVDDADRLLSLSESRRRGALDEIEEFFRRVIGHPVALVLVGTPALAGIVSEYRTTQVVPVDAMPGDAEFATVCGMMFGTRDPAEVTTLHRQSSGSWAGSRTSPACGASRRPTTSRRTRLSGCRRRRPWRTAPDRSQAG